MGAWANVSPEGDPLCCPAGRVYQGHPDTPLNSRLRRCGCTASWWPLSSLQRKTKSVDPWPWTRGHPLGVTPWLGLSGPWDRSTSHSTGGGQRNGRVTPNVGPGQPQGETPGVTTLLWPKRGAGQGHGVESPPLGSQHSGPAIDRGSCVTAGAISGSLTPSPPPHAEPLAEGRKVLEDRGGKRGRGPSEESPRRAFANTSPGAVARPTLGEAEAGGCDGTGQPERPQTGWGRAAGRGPFWASRAGPGAQRTTSVQASPGPTTRERHSRTRGP